MTTFYNPPEETAESQDEDNTNADLPASTSEVRHPGGGRRLGEGTSDPQPIPTTSSSSQSSRPLKRAAAQKKFATLGDFGNDPHGHDDPNDSDYDDDKHDLFAGGEKSGLAVQNPDDLKKKILEKARKNKPRPGGDDPRPRVNHFTGTARTLGGDDAPSQTIEPPPDPLAGRRPERVDRILHFWNDGFSVDDGDLYSTSDPRNAEILNGIRQGRAPLSIMNVQPGQEVDVEIKQHEGNYVKPKQKYKPFSGQGNRLGSPTPGDSLTGASITPAAPPAAASSTSEEPPKVEIDEAQPVITLQIRLGNGTRLPSRFNPSHTIGDVYSFVAAASPDSQTREWALMTTFPSTELTDRSVALGDLPELKRGGVLVQKWR
ncbi:UBX domain-containing protein 1 [Endocarpon pusillum Z07020]|uniref:UBX domain-containing protein 1 n=1 Tax=Endocarpon pusillum (strain Z07020 / HMAS-L-300199) TaxID=1263415 RepID=U1HRP6_ENDPU|nr:UBX domain-containing protein 1 [Endocarpon pusillum Z07020]ERF73165.1 UBX domain-containing protein 1 [Endocarpon pusillum Z07020]